MFKYNDKEYIVQPISTNDINIAKRRIFREFLRDYDNVKDREFIIENVRDCIKKFPIEMGECIREHSLLYVKFICLEDGEEIFIRLGCPRNIKFKEDCGLSCDDCWSRAVGIFLSEENKRDVANACSENGIELITKFETREEKVEFLNNLKEVKHIKCQDANVFKVKDKTYSMCPIDAGLESNFDIKNSCRFNCSECTKCWNRNIKDFLEDEE